MKVTDEVRSIVDKWFIYPLALLLVAMFVNGSPVQFPHVLVVHLCHLHVAMGIHYIHLSAMYKGLYGMQFHAHKGKIYKEAQKAALEDYIWVISSVVARIRSSELVRWMFDTPREEQARRRDMGY
jgi:hypothetical protein